MIRPIERNAPAVSTDVPDSGAVPPTGPHAGVILLPLDQIVPDPHQPRRDWRHSQGAQRLEDLAGSIAEFGILQPLLVRRITPATEGGPGYMLIAGARRRIAAQRAGLTVVPAVIREEESERLRILQLIENVHRQDLSALDEARAYQELIDMGGQTPSAVAAVVHVSAQQVRDRLRLLANQRLSDCVERRQIAASVAREIAKLDADTATALLVRLATGERLQMADVTLARAAAVAAGLRNPRHKGGGRRSPAHPAASPPPQPAVGTGEQTVFVPPRLRPDDVGGQSGRARAVHQATAVGERPPSRHVDVPHASPHQESLALDEPQGPAGEPPALPAVAAHARGPLSATPPPSDHVWEAHLPSIRPPQLALDSGVHARVVALLQRPEAAVLCHELRALLRLPEATAAVMAAITAGVASDPLPPQPRRWQRV